MHGLYLTTSEPGSELTLQLVVYTINSMRKLKVSECCVEISSRCIASRVRQLNRVMTALYDDALRSAGLTGNQLNVLVFVSRHGSPTAGALARHMQMDASTVSRTIERMRKDGLLLIQEGKDARTRELRLSEKGETMILKAIPAWRKAQKQAQKLLGTFRAGAIASAVRNLRSRTADV
jgi:DNA-binding MarR family transcriptional regulator